MRVLGLDLGTTTLGIAISDKSNTFSLPLCVLRFSKENYQSVLEDLEKIVKEKEITEFALGYPKNMNNSEGFATERSKKFKEMLEKKFSLPVAFVDERLTTLEAEKILLSTDTSRKKRKKQIDGIAANLILETYLKRVRNKNEGTSSEL